MSERCQYCSFDPHGADDYCEDHRPRYCRKHKMWPCVRCVADRLAKGDRLKKTERDELVRTLRAAV